MKPLTKKILNIAILLVLVAWLGIYLKGNLGDFRELELVSPYYFVILVLISLVTYILIGYLNLNLLKPFKVNMNMFEAFSLSIVTGFYNLVTPFRGGAVARAAYLKKKHDFAYVNFLATLSAIYVLVFLVASFLGIVSTLLIYAESEIFSWIIFVIFDLIFIGLLFVAFISPKLKVPKNKWLGRFVKVINGWHLIKKNKRVILTTLIVTLIQILLSSLMLWLQFKTFGIDVSFAAVLFLSAVGNLGLLISITPGNLGINEAIVVFSASTIGITPVASLSAALLGRAVSLVVLFVLGPIFSYTLLKREVKK